MNIISNNYEKILKEMIFNQFSSNLRKELGKNNTNKVFNYIDLISNLDSSLCEIAKNSLVTIFETIDKSYSNSIERKHKYHIKAHSKRSILTIFGEITFTRTFYSDRHNKGSYCYLDRFLGLKKYDYFDPYIKATVVEYSANNSIPTVVNMINELIGNRIKLKEKIKYLNRQTIRNIILEAKLSKPEKKELNTPETLYVIADEKWVHTQRNNNEDVMVKSIVTFDSINSKPRRSLNNKMIFADYKKGLINNVLDYLYYTYDTDKIKNIYVMGDGAKWIKNLPNYFQFNNNINVIYALDKFHFKQAIHHIFLDKNLEEIITSYILNNDKHNFIKACEAINHTSPHRKETIEKKKEYIINNWKNILNLYKYKLSCPMESQISHNLAYLLSSRPKGYSLKMLDKILKIRLLFKNNKNIKELYLNNFNKRTILTINEEENYFSFRNKATYVNYNNLIKEPLYKVPYDNSYHRKYI